MLQSRERRIIGHCLAQKLLPDAVKCSERLFRATEPGVECRFEPAQSEKIHFVPKGMRHGSHASPENLRLPESA